MLKLRILRLYTLSLTALTCIIGLFVPELYRQPEYFFTAVILIIGIPHGALDHLLHFKENGNSFKIKGVFYSSYLIAILLILLIWYFNADLAFGLFLIISAYHFGESQMVGIKAPKMGFKILSLFWGVALLGAIISINIEECLNLFRATKILAWFERSPSQFWNLIFLFGFGGWITTLAILYILHRISISRILYEIFSLVFIIFLASLTNAVFSFSIYFAFWHSLPSLLLEIEKLNDSKRFNFKILKSLLPFTLISYLGLFGIYGITYTFFESLSIFLPFFVLISALTLPHLFVTHEIYSRK